MSEKNRKKRPMSSSRNGTWEGLALAQRTLGRIKRENGFSPSPFPCSLALSQSHTRSNAPGNEAGRRYNFVFGFTTLDRNLSITNHKTQFQFDCLQAFTTLHMMYHEATACHVTGDLTEVLMILNNLLVCCRPHSNKPGTVLRTAYRTHNRLINRQDGSGRVVKVF